MIDSAQFKELIHWRLERGLPITDAYGNKIGEHEETQRIYLHAETGLDYAPQLLAEELASNRKGKYYWKQIHKNNHLLDAECLAAACADNQWLPSLKMYTVYKRQHETAGGAPHPGQKFPAGETGLPASNIAVARSNWMNQ